MDGIHYLVDSSGRKKAVQIDLRKHGALWEDFHDVLVADSRKNEPRVPFEEVKERLRMRNLRARKRKARTSKTRARFRQKVDQGLKELDAGKGIPHNVVRERLKKRF